MYRIPYVTGVASSAGPVDVLQGAAAAAAATAPVAGAESIGPEESDATAGAACSTRAESCTAAGRRPASRCAPDTILCG